jgi:hypothetical protein
MCIIALASTQGTEGTRWYIRDCTDSPQASGNASTKTASERTKTASEDSPIICELLIGIVIFFHEIAKAFYKVV